MTMYGMPYFLEDKSGRLAGSDFIDIHDRMRLSYRCTARDTSHTAFMIYNTSLNVYQGPYPRALMALDFGANHALGTVTFSQPSKVANMPMKKYLPRVSPTSRSRKFVASDSQEYIWSWRSQENQEWTCTNTSGYLIAYYSLKISGEPHYEGSSGCTLTVDESFGHIAAEMLATLMIMRHIAEYNLI